MSKDLAGDFRCMNATIKMECTNNRDAVESLIKIRDKWTEFYKKYVPFFDVYDRLDKLEHGQKNNKQILTSSMELIKKLVEQIEDLKK